MSTTLDPPSIPPPGRLARFSVDQYHRMIASGAFTEDDRIELLAGWVVEKMPKNPLHSIVTGSLHDRLVGVLPEGWHVRNQEPITLTDSEPEPDLAVVQGKRSDYRAGRPTAADLALVVEISDSTMAADRWKRTIYASAGIPCYWIINLIEGVIEIYEQPSVDAGDYESRQIVGKDAALMFNLDEPVALGCCLNELVPSGE